MNNPIISRSPLIPINKNEQPYYTSWIWLIQVYHITYYFMLTGKLDFQTDSISLSFPHGSMSLAPTPPGNLSPSLSSSFSYLQIFPLKWELGKTKIE